MNIIPKVKEPDDFKMDLTGQEKSYLKQLSKFNKLKWLIEGQSYRTGTSFGEFAFANEQLQKKQETMMADEFTGVIIINREDYLKIIEKDRQKQTVDKHDFFKHIPLFQ